MNRILKAIFHPVKALEQIAEASKRRLPQSTSRIASDAKVFWSRSADSSSLRDLSHWQGEGRWSDEGAWNRIGETHFAMYETLCLLANVSRPIASVVEWGPGGGANAVRFVNEVDRFYGLDISSANLTECRRQLESRQFRGFIPVLIDAREPQDALGQIAERVDFFLSTAVFQHFPGKEYGVRVTELAYHLLRDKGIAIIQTRYDDGSEELKPKHRDYAQNAIMFTSYPIQEYWQVALECGFIPVAVILDVKPCYAYYLLRKEVNA